MRREKMKKRVKIVFSATASFVLICLLMLGVYAAISPSVSINGQISYTARDASVLVQGETSNTGSELVFADAPKTKDFSNLTEKTTGTSYVDWTVGEAIGNSSAENETLKDWKIGTISFVEDSTGVKDIAVGFQLTNYSTYPVQATLTFPSGATDSDLANAKVSRTASATSVYLAQNGGNKQIIVTYKLTGDDQSIPADATNLLGMNIKFEKTAMKSDYILTDVERSTGIVTMGKQSADSTTENVQWQCFSYYDETEQKWVTFDSTKGIPAGTKRAYFILNTYVPSLDNKVFLAEDKYAKNSSDNKFYVKEGVNGVTEANTVLANDYYYSDIRQTLKNIETTLNISSDNQVYKAIQGRTMVDLYSAITRTGTQLDLPANVKSETIDKFWLISYKEENLNLSPWMNADSFVEYWYRSPYSSDLTYCACHAYKPGGDTDYDINNTNGARAAFMLKLS